MLSLDYMAGFVDGEGYLGIVKKTNKECIKGYYYKPVIKIAQTITNGFILEEFKLLFGGYISKQRAYKNNARNSVTWEITGKKTVSKFIQLVKPKLVLKKKQAEILSNFILLEKSTNGKGGKFEKKRDRLDEQKTNFYNQILYLNRRGLAETE